MIAPPASRAARRQAFDPSVYLVTDPQAPPLAPLVEQALACGVSAVQLRDKHADEPTLREQAATLLPLTRAAGCMLIINDRPQIVRDCADGLHIGQQDIPCAEARKIIGKDALLGLTVDSLDQLLAVDWALVDYIGAGPIFASPTKPELAPLGLEKLAEICVASKGPVVAIGGLTEDNFAQVRQAGAAGGAVVSAICEAGDPAAAAGRLRRAWLKAPPEKGVNSAKAELGG